MIINVILIIVVIFSGILLVNYNRFIRANNMVSESESTIDVLLNQRFDLLPNIIECVKGYAKHESSTLEELVNLRNTYNNSEFNVNEAEMINKKFGNVVALAEAYPELKANTNFLSLQRSLLDIENKINNARLIYNNCVTKYNNLVEVIPSNIIAKLFSFEKKELFKLDNNKRENIKVDF